MNIAPVALPAGAPPPFFGWGCFEHTEVIFSPCTQPQAPAKTARVAIVLSPSMRSLLRRRGRITLAVTLRLTAACEGREVVLPLVVMR